MPLYHIKLFAKKPLSEGYPKTLKTIGDHIRKRRLDLKLFQKDVAAILCVNECSVYNWENGRSCPAIRFTPNVLEFLGYDPVPTEVASLGQQLRRIRRMNGFSIKSLATKLGIDPSTLGKWERGEGAPSEARQRIAKELLEWNMDDRGGKER